jgi:hypothetical protein
MILFASNNIFSDAKNCCGIKHHKGRLAHDQLRFFAARSDQLVAYSYNLLCAILLELAKHKEINNPSARIN